MHSTYTETLDFIRIKISTSPEIVIVLGTGLGGLAKTIDLECAIPYSEIPHFRNSTVESHAGRLLFGKISGKNVVAMEGRFHFYEGYTMQEVTYPIRIMQLLGVRTLLISNVSGGLNPDFKKGDLVIITDHINLQTANPLIGPYDESFGPRFPDMSEPYANRLIARAEELAKAGGIEVKRGVYVAVNGPNLETRAEYRFLRMIGGDLVGMSTVPEVIVARQMGVKVFAISIVTDECDPDHLEKVSLEDILRSAAMAEPKLTELLTKLIA
jgi:purine-nucleoside phosphorylase